MYTQNIIFILFTFVLTTVLGYNGVLIVENGQRLNLTSFDPKTGEFDPLLILPTTGLVLPLSYSNNIFVYISYSSGSDQLIYLNTQTSTIINSFNLPSGYNYGSTILSNDGTQFYTIQPGSYNFYLYRFNLKDGSLDKSFEIKSPTFLSNIKNVNLYPVFDFLNNRAVVWLNAPGLNNQHQKSIDINNIGVLTCKTSQGCNYLFTLDLEKQQVTDSVNIGFSFGYNQKFGFESLSANTINGVTASSGYHPLSAMNIDITTGVITYIQPTFGLDTYYSNIVSGFQDNLGFVLANNAWYPTEPSYFMVYDFDSNSVLSNVTYPSQTETMVVFPY